MAGQVEATLAPLERARMLKAMAQHLMAHKDELYQVLQTFLQPQENAHV